MPAAECHQGADLIQGLFHVGQHLVVRQPQREVAADDQFEISLAIASESIRSAVPRVTVHLDDHLAFRPEEVHEVAVPLGSPHEFVEVEQAAKLCHGLESFREELLAWAAWMGLPVQGPNPELLPFFGRSGAGIGCDRQLDSLEANAVQGICCGQFGWHEDQHRGGGRCGEPLRRPGEAVESIYRGRGIGECQDEEQPPWLNRQGQLGSLEGGRVRGQARPSSQTATHGGLPIPLGKHLPCGITG